MHLTDDFYEIKYAMKNENESEEMRNVEKCSNLMFLSLIGKVQRRRTEVVIVKHCRLRCTQSQMMQHLIFKNLQELINNHLTSFKCSAVDENCVG